MPKGNDVSRDDHLLLSPSASTPRCGEPRLDRDGDLALRGPGDRDPPGPVPGGLPDLARRGVPGGQFLGQGLRQPVAAPGLRAGRAVAVPGDRADGRDMAGILGASLRLFPTLCSILCLPLFCHVSGRLVGGTAQLLAVAILATSFYPIRHGAEIKPYASDLLAALIFLSLAAGSPEGAPIEPLVVGPRRRHPVAHRGFLSGRVRRGGSRARPGSAGAEVGAASRAPGLDGLQHGAGGLVPDGLPVECRLPGRRHRRIIARAAGPSRSRPSSVPGPCPSGSWTSTPAP